MGFDALVRSGVAIASKVTASLQDDVVHEQWTGLDAYGQPTYGPPVTRKAIVLRDSLTKRDRGGDWVQVQCVITILEPFESNGAAGRNGPVDPRDRMTLSDGFTCPIVEVEGIMDPTVSRPYFSEVWLGYRHR